MVKGQDHSQQGILGFVLSLLEYIYIPILLLLLNQVYAYA